MSCALSFGHLNEVSLLFESIQKSLISWAKWTLSFIKEQLHGVNTAFFSNVYF